MTRNEKILEARRLRDLGWTAPAIGRALGANESTVRNWYLGGTCACGAPITYDSATETPTRCVSCQLVEIHNAKIWTRERVIEAIQKWAREHGRPPTADEWLHSSPDGRFPNRGSVYRTSTNPGAPFAKWADAIEAAGYPRPTTGRRTDREVNTMSNERQGYVVLRETADAWELVKETDEPTQVAALNAALNGHAPEGRWVAIPGRYWRPRELRPRTIYDWAEETAPTP